MRPAIVTWSHVGLDRVVRLDCAVHWGFCGWNGYVRLPIDSPDRVLGEAYDDYKRNDPDEKATRALWGFSYRPSSYDSLDVVVHGGLTYGIDDDGWVGFDTSHAGDDVDVDEVAAILPELDADAWEIWQQSAAAMKAVGLPWPPGAMTDRLTSRSRWHRKWTIAAVVDETNRLAAQLAAHLSIMNTTR